MVAMVTGLATSLCPSTLDTEALVVSEMEAFVSRFILSNHLSLVARKPVLGVSDQVRHLAELL